MRPAVHLSILAVLAVVPSLAMATEEGKPDPWAIPAPDPAKILLALQESKREYQIVGEAKVPDSARIPQTVTAGTTDDEKKALRACRDLLAAEKWSEAAESLDELLKKNPSLHEARMLLGVSLLRRKKPEEAVAALRDALVGNRRNAEGWKALEETAAALGKKVVRPDLQPQSWIAPGKGEVVEIGFVVKGGPATADDPGRPAWGMYSIARAWYRYEGSYTADFPGETYRLTFREILTSVGAMIKATRNMQEQGEKLSDDQERLLAEEKAGTLVPFVFFALYTEPLPAKDEKGLDVLRPRLVKYFEEKILVKK